jgi:hypothetical protein
VELLDKTLGGVPFQISPQLEKAGVKHGFTTRLGGVSEGIYASLNLGVNRGDDPERVRENYRRVSEALGVDRDRLVFSSQVHEDAVRPVTLEDAGKGLDRPVDYQADGLVTDVPGLPLVVFGADCLTVLLCDPVRQVIAAVHAGWRGTALGIVERAVEAMKGYGCEPQNILAAIGPGISKCCFETREDVPEAMTAALGEAARPFLLEEGEGKFRVDLKGINALRLQRAGVPTANVDVSTDCTFCKHDKYWSHRYTKGERGSQAALICL